LILFIVGVVVQNKQRKAMIEYSESDSKKRLLTIPQFFKTVTGNPLHAKGRTDQRKNFFQHKYKEKKSVRI
jgi:hypothetical protein